MTNSLTYDSPLGPIRIVAAGGKLVALWFEGRVRYPPNVEVIETDRERALLAEVKQWLNAYFARQNPDPQTLPLAPQGSDFQQAVWRELLRIPYGEIVTYGAIATKIARARGMERMASQAVGGAVGRNPISIIIPCHRVVGSGGNLTGYGGGIQNKVKLLELEGVDLETLIVPTKGTAL